MDRTVVQNIVDSIAKVSDDELINKSAELINSGYSATQILNQFFNSVVENAKISTLAKSKILQLIAKIEANLIQGSRDDI